MNYQLLKTIIDTELKRFEIISEDEWAYKKLSGEMVHVKKFLDIFVTVLLQIFADL